MLKKTTIRVFFTSSELDYCLLHLNLERWRAVELDFIFEVREISRDELREVYEIFM